MCGSLKAKDVIQISGNTFAHTHNNTKTIQTSNMRHLLYTECADKGQDLRLAHDLHM